MSSDLTFLTNEPGKHRRDRFGVLLGNDTRLYGLTPEEINIVEDAAR